MFSELHKIFIFLILFSVNFELVTWILLLLIFSFLNLRDSVSLLFLLLIYMNRQTLISPVQRFLFFFWKLTYTISNAGLRTFYMMYRCVLIVLKLHSTQLKDQIIAKPT